jgi:hypothetical protein
MTIMHRDQKGTQVHVIHFAEYPDAAARESDTSLDSTHEGKIALQLDDGSFWRLLSGGSTPEWERFGRAGTASLRNVGTGDNDVATVGTVKSLSNAYMYVPQSVVRGIVGKRPEGWSAAECATQTIALLGNTLSKHRGAWSPSGVASASSTYSAAYPAWSAVDGIANTLWLSADVFPGAVGSAIFIYELPAPRDFDSIEFSEFNGSGSTAAFPKNFDIYIDGALNTSVVGAVTAGANVIKSFPLTTPVAGGKKVELRITATNGLARTGFNNFGIGFTDVGAASVGAVQGLQVAYAEKGQVKLSEPAPAVLARALTGEPDGRYFIAANLNADGSHASLTYTGIRPEVGNVRAVVGADLYDPATVTMIDSGNAEVRRVYLGYVDKSGDDVIAFSFFAGRSAKIPLNAGGNIGIGAQYKTEIPFLSNELPSVMRYDSTRGWSHMNDLFISATGKYGYSASWLDEEDHFIKFDNYVDYLTDGSNITSAKAVLEFYRGY